MLNINKFKSAVHKYDLERPNLFAVQFAVPSLLTPAASLLVENGQLITLFCKNANLPGINVSLADNQRYGLGPNVRMPVRGSLNDISLTFLNDAGGRLHVFFTEWIFNIYRQHGPSNRKFQPGEPGLGPVKGVSAYEIAYKKNYQCNFNIITYRGEPGKTGGSGILQTIASVASASAGVPFLGSLLGGRVGAQHDLVISRKYTFNDAFPTNISDISLSSSGSDSVTEFTVGFTYLNFGYGLYDIDNVGRV